MSLLEIYNPILAEEVRERCDCIMPDGNGYPTDHALRRAIEAGGAEVIEPDDVLLFSTPEHWLCERCDCLAFINQQCYVCNHNADGREE